MPSHFSTPEEDKAWVVRLRSLRDADQPEPRPFLYARLQARLAAEATPPVLPGWLRRPAYAFSLGALVLALNVGAAVHYVRQPPPKTPAAGYAAFAAEYQLDPFSTSHE